MSNNEAMFMGIPVSEILEWRDTRMNIRRVVPLRKYEVIKYGGAGKDTFTATHHNTTDGIVKFYSDGQIIREYHMPIECIVISPVDHTPEVQK
ncbi:MAG TPA: hypothetical protein VIY48_06520 [Candidatus Paceibacterota bacterium]